MSVARGRSARETAASKRGFDDLCKMMKMPSEEDDEGPRLSKKDRMLKAANKMNETSARLEGSCFIILDKCIEILKDGDASDNKRRQMVSTLNKFIKPLLKNAATQLNNAAGDVAPMAATAKVHSQMETDRKKAARRDVGKAGKKNDQVALQARLIGYYLEEKPIAKSPSTDDATSQRKKKPRMAKVRL